jgi:hypothetical protein
VNADVLIGGIDFDLWLDQIGRSRSTGLRWRNRRWVTTVNIDGHQFIAQEEIDRFWARAKAGEFAKEAGGIICMQREEAAKTVFKSRGTKRSQNKKLAPSLDPVPASHGLATSGPIPPPKPPVG